MHKLPSETSPVGKADIDEILSELFVLQFTNPSAPSEIYNSNKTNMSNDEIISSLMSSQILEQRIYNIPVAIHLAERKIQTQVAGKKNENIPPLLAANVKKGILFYTNA